MTTKDNDSPDELEDAFADGNGHSLDHVDNAEGVEIFTVADELGCGVYVSCAADTTPADLVAGLCDLISQITQAVIAQPEAKRAGDLELEEMDGDDFS